MSTEKEPENRSRINRRAFLKYAVLAAGLGASSSLVGLGCGEPAVPASPAAPAQPAAAPKAAAPAQVSSGAKEVKVGLIHPLTGPAALDGTQCNNGSVLAFDQANAAGGIKSMGGAKITILQGDHQGKPEVGAAEAQRLIQEGALVLLGAFQAPVTVASSLEAEKAKTPYMGTVIAADEFTERGFKYVVRVQPKSSIFGKWAAEYLKILSAAGPKIQRIAILHYNGVGMTQTANAEEKFFKEAGFEVVQKLSFPTGTPDFTSELNRIKGAKPDIVIVGSFFADALLAARTYQELKIEAHALMGVANGGFSNPQFIKELGKQAEGIFDVNYWYNPKNPKTKQVGDEFQKRYGQPMSSHVVQSYVAAQVVVDALERAASTDKEKIMDALKKTNFTDHIFPQGAIKFDDAGDNVNATAPMMQIQGGASKVVLPADYSEAKPIFPVKF